MNDSSNRKADSRRIKYIIGAIAVAAVYLALLASLLIDSTTAKYRETRTILTDYDIASFNTVLRGAGGNETYADVKQALNNNSLKAFAQEFNAKDFLPGSTDRKLAFTVTNGTTDDNLSEVATDYTIKLRVTRNLPLDFTLSYTTSETTTTYLPGTPVQVTMSGYVDGDVKWYEYSFYEKKTDGSGTAITDADGNEIPDTDKEAKFSLKGRELDLNLHAINITWPIRDAGTETVIIDGSESTIQRLKSNDTDYMKEVEMLEVVVSSVSANPVAESGAKTEIEVRQAPAGTDYHSTGILYIIDGNSYSIDVDTKDTVHNFTYEIDYRAFNRSKETDPYSFTMKIEDGIREINSPTEAVQALYPKYSFYTLRMRVPVAAIDYNKEDGTSDFSNENYNYLIRLSNNGNVPVTLTRIPEQSRYYIYKVNKDYPSIVENAKLLTGVSTDAQALKYWSELKEDEQVESYIYRLDIYTNPVSETSGFEFVNKNTIKHVDPLLKDEKEKILKISGNDDTVEIEIYKNNEIADISSILDKETGTTKGSYENFSVDHKLYIDVDVVYSDSERVTGLLPAAINGQ